MANCALRTIKLDAPALLLRRSGTTSLRAPVTARLSVPRVQRAQQPSQRPSSGSIRGGDGGRSNTLSLAVSATTGVGVDTNDPVGATPTRRPPCAISTVNTLPSPVFN
jgi:hypothetical protein